MGQALYRKYRSKSLGEIVGQEHITHTLEQAIKQGRISHAYLFTGPRGVGKTSVARILAHEINGLPYADDSPHMDIIEIDAASNRRIDEIRELRDKIYVAPTSLKYKVYIIDEVHMLTKEAFNALLKTLEEPPEHAVFILATTDAHKLPETIISRTQRFTFRPVDRKQVVKHLSEIAKEEKIKISPEALELVAEHGEGSFRDSISLLDQLGNHGGQVDAQAVEQLLGVPSSEVVGGVLEAIGPQGDTATLMVRLDALFAAGYQASGIAKQLARALRTQLVDGTTVLSPEATLELLDQLIRVPASHDPDRFLEVVLLRFCPTAPQAVSKPPAEKPKPAAEAVPAAPAKQEVSEQKPKAKPGSAPFDEKIWPAVLQTLKKQHNTLYGVVRMAQPAFSGDTLELTFAFAFHEKRIKESANRQKLSDVIYGLTGQEISVACRLDPEV
jgi:DNA polymerase-3 subunit gamma/tau